MLNVVVFSKDRPAQLELLLRSLQRYLAGWEQLAPRVLYACSDERAEAGYDLVEHLYPQVEWHVQHGGRSFKEHVLGLVDPARPLTVFLVDDDVLKAAVSVADDEIEQLARDPELLCVSLRMAPHMDYCYSEDLSTPPPAFAPRNTWAWQGLAGDWGYPMSLDGHVFRTAEILPLLETLDYRDPNSLEAALAAVPPARPLVRCYASARLVNIPANRVQDTAPNRHAGISVETLTERFLAGERLSLATVVGVRTPAPHHELPFRWEPRADSAPRIAAPLKAAAPPEKLRVGLLCIATSDYLGWAARMVESAQVHLLPGHELHPFVFSDGHLGRSRLGFPGATLYRYHVFAEHRRWLEQLDYLFYCDADMLFVDTVGEEILGRLTGTQHPGYVGVRGPYEDRPESAACVGAHEGVEYFCGGFNGGEAGAFLELAETLAARIDRDDAAGITAVWHDESHLNRYFVDTPPETVLSPSYTYPEVVHPHYRQLWREAYAPRLVALDKRDGQFRVESVAAARRLGEPEDAAA